MTFWGPKANFFTKRSHTGFVRFAKGKPSFTVSKSGLCGLQGHLFFDIFMLRFCNRFFNWFFDGFALSWDLFWHPFGSLRVLLAYFSLPKSSLGRSSGSWWGPRGPLGIFGATLGFQMRPESSKLTTQSRKSISQMLKIVPKKIPTRFQNDCTKNSKHRVIDLQYVENRP